MPRIGKRILKSAVGVWLCYIVQKLRGGSGIVFYSQLAVLWCVQPYINESMKKGIQRAVGTLVGAAYGLVVIWISIYGLPGVFVNEDLYALLIGAGVLMVLYTTVVIRKVDAAYFSAVVFLSIVVNHIGDNDPYLFVWNRVLDTMIGIVLGVGINMARLPRKKQKDSLFISGIDDTLLNEKEKISAYSKIELNRMLDEGARFTVSTMRTPASIIDVLGGIHWNLPLIVMDGAALYDMREHSYMKTVSLSPENTEKIKQFFKHQEMNCFMNILINGLLVISYEELRTETEKHIYREMRKSPYRNYVQKDMTADGELLYFMAVGEKEKMDHVVLKLKQQEYYDEQKSFIILPLIIMGRCILRFMTKKQQKRI